MLLLFFLHVLCPMPHPFVKGEVVMGLSLPSYALEYRGETIETPPRKLSIDPDKADIQGVYHYRGKDISGKPYQGVASVLKTGDVYLVQQTIVGGPASIGVGVRIGDILSVGWTLPGKDGGVIRGTSLFRIGATDPGGTSLYLKGTWGTYPGNGRRGEETMVRVRELEPDEE